jgi:putative glutamine amidotransferase
MLKLGLSQRVVSVEAYRERRDCLDQMWTRRLLAEGYWPVPLPNCVEDVDSLVAALGLDGVILTGGNDLSTLPGASNPAPERDDFEHRLIDVAAKRRLPLLGVCRGLQVLVTHWGGRLTAVSGHVNCNHRLVATPDSRFPIVDRESVNSFHGYGVRVEDVGKLEIAATAPDGTVEAVTHARLPQWGVMWHPERPPTDPRDGQLFRTVFRRKTQ